MEIKIKKIDWTDDLDCELLPVLGDDLKAIKEEVQLDISELWEVENDGFTITRLENDLSGEPFELCFIAGIGKNAKLVIQAFIDQVKPLGVSRFRLHSSRPGMGKYLSSLGFLKSETVYTKVGL